MSYYISYCIPGILLSIEYTMILSYYSCCTINFYCIDLSYVYHAYIRGEQFIENAGGPTFDGSRVELTYRRGPHTGTRVVRSEQYLYDTYPHLPADLIDCVCLVK